MATEKNLRGLFYLRILLVCGLVNELTSDVMRYYTQWGDAPDHFYIPLEYILLSLFFITVSSNSLVKKIISISIPVYLVLSVYFSVTHYTLKSYPAIPYNIGCFFTILWAVFTMFTLEVKEDLKVTSLPIFWICTGIIIFYMGVFFYNAVYNYLLKEKTALANSLRSIINLNLNFLFYIIWSYAFICSIRLKKYFIR